MWSVSYTHLRELDQAVREELAAYRQQLLVELDGQLSRALANGPY